MAEPFISKRVEFPRGQQKLFLLKSIKKLQLSHFEAAKLLQIHVRTLSDWKREKFLMPYRAAKILSTKSRIALPRSLKIRDPYWYASKAAHLGGLAIMKKYGSVGGDPERRKMRWRKWWTEKGKYLQHYSFIGKRKTIFLPRKTNLLAEFVGIMMGDGGISKMQITITLNREDDYLYSLYVRKLLKKLFGVQPSIFYSKKERVVDIVISRVKLVVFCKRIGLKIGHKIKQGLDIPEWVKRYKSFKKACIRGLVDTDGCLVIHRYRVNGKKYCYKKINFTSASPPLIESVLFILQEFGFHPRKDRSGRQIWLDNQAEVRKYMDVIGTHNPKHKRRFLSRRGA